MIAQVLVVDDELPTVFVSDSDKQAIDKFVAEARAPPLLELRVPDALAARQRTVLEQLEHERVRVWPAAHRCNERRR